MKTLFCELGEVSRQGHKISYSESQIICSSVQEDGSVATVTGLVEAMHKFNLTATNAQKEGSPLVWCNLSQLNLSQVIFNENIDIDATDKNLTLITSNDFSVLFTHKNQFFNYERTLKISGQSNKSKPEQYVYAHNFLSNMDVLSKRYFNDILHSIFDDPNKHFKVGTKAIQGLRKTDLERFNEGVINGSKQDFFFQNNVDYSDSLLNEIELSSDNIGIFKKIILKDIPSEKSNIQIVQGDFSYSTDKKVLGYLVQLEPNKEIFLVSELFKRLKTDERFKHITSKSYATVLFDPSINKNKFPISKGLFLPYAECSLALNALSNFILNGLINNEDWFFSSYVKLLHTQYEMIERVFCLSKQCLLKIEENRVVLSYKMDSVPNSIMERLLNFGYYPLDESLCDKSWVSKANSTLDKVRRYSYLNPKKETLSNIVEEVFSINDSFDGSQASRFAVETNILKKLTSHLKGS